MRAERRHRLETNLLADFFGRLLTILRPWLKWLVAAAVAVLLGYLVFEFVIWSEASRRAEAWHQFLRAQGPDDYQRLREQFPDTLVGIGATLRLADAYYTEGLLHLGRDPQRAEVRLKQALELYQDAAARAAQVGVLDPVVEHRARLGVAQAHEALGHRAEALKLYEEIVQLFPHTWAARRAQEHYDRLQAGEAAEFYAAIKKVQPAPRKAESPSLLDLLAPPAGGPPASPEPGLEGPADKSSAVGPQAPPKGAPAPKIPETTGDSPSSSPSSEAPQSPMGPASQKSAPQPPTDGPAASPRPGAAPEAPK